MKQGPTREDVADALTHSEYGEGRDISFLGVDAQGAAALLRWLARRYVPGVLTESPGEEEDIPRDVPGACAAITQGQMVFGSFTEGPPQLRSLSFCLVPDACEPWWRMELDFDPSDVELHGGLDSFITLLEEACHECRATEYRVHGDGVIYTSEDVPRLLQSEAG